MNIQKLPARAAVAAVLAVAGVAGASIAAGAAASPTVVLQSDGHGHDDGDGHDHADEHDHDSPHGHVGDEVSQQGTAQGATELHEAAPRLLVADGQHGTVEVLDLTTGESLVTLDVAGAATLVSDGRFVLAVATDHDAVTIIDGGAWVAGHGDHNHYFAKDAAVLGTAAGPTPIHTVVNDGQIVVFFDGDGTAASFTSGALADGDVEPWLTIATAAPQHGVVAGLGGHHVVSVPAATAGDLPTGVQVLHGGAELEADFSEDCPELHGEAAFASGVLLACDDGALWVAGSEGSWTATTIEWPNADDGEARAWSFAHTHGIPVVAGVAGEGLVTIDVEAGTANRIAAPGDVVNLAVVNDGAELLVITRDGVGHLVDATTGDVVTNAALVSATPADVAGYQAGAPKIVVSGARAYVSDPAAGTVVEVATNDDLRVARTFEVGVSPGSLAVVGDH